MPLPQLLTTLQSHFAVTTIDTLSQLKEMIVEFAPSQWEQHGECLVLNSTACATRISNDPKHRAPLAIMDHMPPSTLRKMNPSLPQQQSYMHPAPTPTEGAPLRALPVEAPPPYPVVPLTMSDFCFRVELREIPPPPYAATSKAKKHVEEKWN